LSRTEESRLFIDINTKQRPVPAQLLLDIKKLAEIEDESEATLRDIFDLFHEDKKSSLKGLTAPFESAKNKLSRPTFNSSVKPLLDLFPGREPQEIYDIINNYLNATSSCIAEKTSEILLAKPVVFRAFIGLFPFVAQRVQDKFTGRYSPANFVDVISPLFSNMPMNKLRSPGTSWVALRDYLEKRLRSKMAL